MSAAARFAEDVRRTLRAAGAPAGAPWYRRAVPTDARASLPPPPLPHPLLVVAGPPGFAAILATDVTDAGRVDEALHAARAAGLAWCVASAADVRAEALLRSLRFVALSPDA